MKYPFLFPKLFAPLIIYKSAIDKKLFILLLPITKILLNMTLIDGKAISEQVKQEIAAEVAEIVAHGGKRPPLAAILVGHDGGI